jgi:hypothetical protein
MAIYRLSVKPMSRKAGRSATAAAAYRAAERIHDVTTDQVFDYTRKRGVEHAEIVLPAECAKQDINWARDRQALWNAAEQAENRSNSRVAREYELALPHELNKAQRLELVREFAADIANRHGVAVDFAIHAPHRHGDDRNWHAHLMATTRTIEAKGLGAKAAMEWSDGNRRLAGLGKAKAELKDIRGLWEVRANEKLKEQGLEIRIDHRSLAAQGIERTPTTHLGPAVTGMERRGIETEVGKRIGLEQASKQLRQAAELGRIERELVQTRKQILDVSMNLAAALKERDAGQEMGLGQAAARPRGMFDGLHLKAGERVAGRELFADMRLAGHERVPERIREATPDLNRALDRYARAWMDVSRMQQKQLPILEHQKSALREAGLALEGVRAGASADLHRALAHEPRTYQAMTQLRGLERTAQLHSALDHEARVRTDPDLKAERLVKVWKGLEAQRERLSGWEHKVEREQVKEQLHSLAAELKRDAPLEATLQRRQQALGIEPGSRLDRVMKEPTMERALELSVRDLGRDHDQGLGM